MRSVIARTVATATQSLVNGTAGIFACACNGAPSTALRAVPLPRKGGGGN
jgi:hypothetical protein